MAKMCIQIFQKKKTKTNKQNKTKAEKNKQRRDKRKWKERKEETGFSKHLMPKIGGAWKKVGAWWELYFPGV